MNTTTNTTTNVTANKKFTGIKIPKEMTYLLRDDITQDGIELVRQALNYQYQDMRHIATLDLISSLNKKIANNNNKYTATQIEGFKQDLEVAKTNLNNAKEQLAYFQSSFDSVVELSGEDGEHVSRLLRLYASWYDNKYNGYVLSVEDFGEANIDKITKVMTEIHESYDSDGFMSADEQTKKRCTKMLNGVFRTLFSIFSDDNPFFRQMKLTYIVKNSDGTTSGKLLHKIHATWITGLRENVKKDEDGNVTRSESTLIHGVTFRKNDGQKKYDIKKFARTICSVSKDAIHIFVNGIVQSKATISSIVEDTEVREKTETKQNEKTAPVDWLKSFKNNDERKEWLVSHNIEFKKSAKAEELEKLMIANYKEEEVA